MSDPIVAATTISEVKPHPNAEPADDANKPRCGKGTYGLRASE